MSGGESTGEMSQDASAGNDGKDVADPSVYENRGPKKIIRLITVMAYIFSVSFVAIALSAYYVFLWEPPNPRLLHTSRYRGDPHVQYLQAHPSYETVHGLHDYDNPGHFVLEANNHLARSQRPLASAPANPRYFGNRDTLNKSLELLRTSIIDLLREHENGSTNPANLSSKNVSDFENATKIAVNNGTTMSKTIVFSTNLSNSTVNNLKVPSVVKSTIISGTEKSVDRMTNRSSLKAYDRYNEMIVSHLQNQLNQLQKKNVSLKIYDERDGHFSLNVSEKKQPRATSIEHDLQAVKSLMTSGKKKNQRSPAELVAHVPIHHSPSKNKQSLRSNPVEAEDRSTKRSILSSRDSRFNVSVKFFEETEMQPTQQSLDATNSEETQIENVATKSTTDDEELNNVTTPQPKGLLTLLIQSTDMKSVYRKVQSTEKISSSTVMTATTTSSISTKRNTSVNISEEEIL